jgi:regulator of sigma E protease
MEFVDGIGTYIVPFLIVLTLLVFFHELGHYWVARRCGVRVDVFSVGFGPELFGWTDRAGTRWKFSAVPFGGYVKMFGEADATGTLDGNPATMTPAERAVSFHHKRLYQRIAIVAAGPIANFLLAVVIFAGVFGILGQPFTPPLIGGVLPGSAAEGAGIKAGDLVLQMGGQAIERFEEIQRIVQLNLEQPIDIIVLRDGHEVTIRVAPTVVEETDRLGNRMRIARIGVRGEGIAFVRHDPVEAVWRGLIETYVQTAGTLKAVGQMIVGRRTTEELGGPIRIAQMSGQVAQGGIGSLLVFMAVLSVNLGLINLFPIPMLDGGHLLYYAAEAVRGRPLGMRAQEYGFRIGLALVLSLMVFATWNDLVHLRVIQYLVGLIS